MLVPRPAQFDRTIVALTERVLQRVQGGVREGVRIPELVEAAGQIIIASKGSKMLEETTQNQEKQVGEGFRQRLQLELRASERCLESALRFDDHYSKLVFRLFA